MRKKIIAYTLGTLLLVGSTLAANFVVAEAANPTVTFTQDHSISVTGVDGSVNNAGNVNFGDVFTDVMPGETRSLNIALVNASDVTTHFYMSTSALNAFEDAQSAHGAAYDIIIETNSGGDTSTIFDSAVGGFASATATQGGGLGDISDSFLADYVLVATVQPHASTSLTFQVAFDGHGMTNNQSIDYSDLQAALAFTFQARYDAPGTPTPVPVDGPVRVVDRIREVPRNVYRQVINVVAPGTTTTTTTNATAPETRDTARIGLASLVLIGGMLLIVFGKDKDKKRRNDMKGEA